MITLEGRYIITNLPNGVVFQVAALAAPAPYPGGFPYPALFPIGLEVNYDGKRVTIQEANIAIQDQIEQGESRLNLYGITYKVVNAEGWWFADEISLLLANPHMNPINGSAALIQLAGLWDRRLEPIIKAIIQNIQNDGPLAH